MSTRKISQLAALGGVPATDDLLPIVDVSALTTKNVDVGGLRGGYLTDLTTTSIKDFSDVFSSMTPTEGQALIYDTVNGWQSETISAATAGTADFVASGAIANGELVALKADGTVTAPASTNTGFGTLNDSLSSLGVQQAVATDTSTDAIIMVYPDTTNNYVAVRRCTLDKLTGDITQGAEVIAHSATYTYVNACTDNNGTVFIVYRNSSSSGQLWGVAGTIGATTVTFGTPINLGTGTNINWPYAAYDPVQQKYLVVYGIGNGYTVVCSISGTTITAQTAVSRSGWVADFWLCFL